MNCRSVFFGMKCQLELAHSGDHRHDRPGEVVEWETNYADRRFPTRLKRYYFDSEASTEALDKH